MAQFVEKIDLEIFLEKKIFFWDLGQKKVKNFFFIFRLQMAQFVQKTGLEKNLRLFVKKHQTLEAYISANTHPNNFWTTFLESESQNKPTLRKLAVTHVYITKNDISDRQTDRRTDRRTPRVLAPHTVSAKKFFFL